jgi:hypothetical protein
MEEYIKRKDAVDWFMGFIHLGEDNLPADTVVSDLKYAIPAADVEPVRHGRWIWHEETFEYECSDCHCRFDYGHTYELFDHGFQFANYCPKCGANMDGENTETTKPSSRSLGLLPCPVCHGFPHLRFWGDSDYYFECHIARKPLEPQEHFPTMQEAAKAWNEKVRCINEEMNDAD